MKVEDGKEVRSERGEPRFRGSATTPWGLRRAGGKPPVCAVSAVSWQCFGVQLAAVAGYRGTFGDQWSTGRGVCGGGEGIRALPKVKKGPTKDPPGLLSVSRRALALARNSGVKWPLKDS